MSCFGVCLDLDYLHLVGVKPHDDSVLMPVPLRAVLTPRRQNPEPCAAYQDRLRVTDNWTIHFSGTRALAGVRRWRGSLMASIELGSHVWINTLGVQQLRERPLSHRVFQNVNTKAPFEVVDSWRDDQGHQHCLLASADYPVGKRPKIGWVDTEGIRMILTDVAALLPPPVELVGD